MTEQWQRRVTAFAGTAVLAGIVACGGGEPPEQAADVPSGVTAFVGARIIDGTGNAPIADGVLVVRDGRIEAVGGRDAVEVPAGARRIDVAGKTIVPGLINAHGHVSDVQGLEAKPEFYTREHVERQLDVYARYGVTTVFSLGGDQPLGLDLRHERSSPEIRRARAYMAGPVVASESVEDARETVDRVGDMNVDIVKIRVDDNLGTSQKMPEAVYRAVIEQAHARGLRVAAHIYYLDDAKRLLAAGVDYLAHSVRDRLVDADLIAAMTSRDVCLCPTLMREVSTYVYESRPAFFDDPAFLREADPAVLAELQLPERMERVGSSRSAQAYKKALGVAMANVKALSDAGVRIAFGTDTGPAARFQGYFEHLELQKLVEAGLTPMQAIVSATGDAARCMGVTHVGTLETGKEADLIVLGANPLDDIRNSLAIESVWVRGNAVPREAAQTTED